MKIHIKLHLIITGKEISLVCPDSFNRAPTGVPIFLLYLSSFIAFLDLVAMDEVRKYDDGVRGGHSNKFPTFSYIPDMALAEKGTPTLLAGCPLRRLGHDS